MSAKLSRAQAQALRLLDDGWVFWYDGHGTWVRGQERTPFGPGISTLRVLHRLGYTETESWNEGHFLRSTYTTEYRRKKP